MTGAGSSAVARLSPSDAGQRGAYPLAVGLATLAGAVDAVGFVQWGGLFVSFMSGNSTILGVKAAGGAGSGALLSVGVIGAFVAGVAIGEMLATSVGTYARAAVLLLETVLLGLGAVASHLGLAEGVVAPVLSLAMGVQNGSIHRAGGIAVSLTYVTGTLVHIGRSAGRALLGHAPWSATLPYLGLWCGLVGGSVLGARVAVHSETVALVGAAATALTLTAIVAAMARDRAALPTEAGGLAASALEE